MTNPKYKWEIRAFYNDTVKPPRRPGQLALATRHVDDLSKDIELDTFTRRSDIGDIVVRLLWKDKS